MGIQYTKASDFPQSYRYVLLSPTEQIAVFGQHDMIELQTTYPFSTAATEKFFQMDKSTKNGIKRALESMIATLNVKYMIIIDDHDRFFGFSLSIPLYDASVVDFRNGYNELKETRELIAAQANDFITQLT